MLASGGLPETGEVEAWLAPGAPLVVERVSETSLSYRAFDSVTGISVGWDAATPGEALDKAFCDQYRSDSSELFGPAVLFDSRVHVVNCGLGLARPVACSVPARAPLRALTIEP